MPRRKRTTALTIRELAPGDRVFAHCRDSGGNAQERSVADQRTAIERYTAERGLIIAGWYIDEATASGDYARRSDFAAMIEACRADPAPVAGVITYAASRWGRDEYDSAFYRIELRRHGVQVVSIVDPVPVGPFMAILETFQDWKNRTFLDDMSVQVRRGLRANVEAGYAPGGRPPTGYMAEQVAIGHKRDGSPRTVARWVVDPETGPLVTRAFQLAAAGFPYSAIHEHLHLLGAKESYVAMFRNRTYLGILKLGDEEFPDKIPPLVDRATWDAVQARILPRREQARTARRRNSPFLLSGLAHCGLCGTSMEGSNDVRPGRVDEPSARAYRCRTPGCAIGRVATLGPDTAVLRVVLEQVLTPAHMRELLASVRAYLDDPTVAEDLARLTVQLVGIKRAAAKLIDALEAGTGGALTAERLRARETEYAQVAQRVEELRQRQALAGWVITDEAVDGILHEMRTQVTAEETPAARRALARLVRRVSVWPDRVRIEFAEVDLAAVVAGYDGMPPRGLLLIPALLVIAGIYWSETLDSVHGS